MPGRLIANGVTVPACGPASQYFDSRRPCVSANHQGRSVRRGRNAVGEVQPGDDGQHGAVGIATEQAAAATGFKERSHVVGIGEGAGRLGEIDCAVRGLGDIRAELQRAGRRPRRPRSRTCRCARVHRQQAAGAVAHQQPSVASHAPVPAVGHLCRRRPSARRRRGDPHDAAVVDTGPDLAIGVDHDILRRVAGNGDDGEVGRSEVRQRVDRRWLPADGIDRRLAARWSRRRR